MVEGSRLCARCGRRLAGALTRCPHCDREDQLRTIERGASEPPIEPVEPRRIPLLVVIQASVATIGGGIACKKLIDAGSWALEQLRAPDPDPKPWGYGHALVFLGVVVAGAFVGAAGCGLSVIAGIGVLFRRRWGQILSLVVAGGLLLVFGSVLVQMVFRPASRPPPGVVVWPYVLGLTAFPCFTFYALLHAEGRRWFRRPLRARRPNGPRSDRR